MRGLHQQCDRCDQELPAQSAKATSSTNACRDWPATRLGPPGTQPSGEGVLVGRPGQPNTAQSDLLIEQSDGVATITLNRPKARNAYSDAMLQGVCQALDRFEQEAQVRVVVLRGSGPSFCAGGDLKAMRDRSGMFAGNPLELRTRYHQGIQGMSRRIARFEKPLIAGIHGAAIGAGLDLACMCDVRIASRSAKFGSTFVKVGLIPGDGGALFLSRIVGFARGLELMMSARIIDANEAHSIGLVNILCEDDQLDEQVASYAAALAKLPPGALAMTKRLCYQSAPNQQIESALQMAAAMQGLVQHHPDHEAAVAKLLAR